MPASGDDGYASGDSAPHGLMLVVVLAGSDRLQVRRVDAQPVAADVMHLAPARDRPFVRHEERAVSVDADAPTALARENDKPVAAARLPTPDDALPAHGVS